MLVERVFRREELNQDKVLGKSDLDAMEKEISIDIAELKRDLKRVSKEIHEKFTIHDSKIERYNNNIKDIVQDNERDKSDTQNLNLDTEEDKSKRRNSNRQRKKSVLNEASYLADRLSRALSNSNILTCDEKQCDECDELVKREGSSKIFS